MDTEKEPSKKEGKPAEEQEIPKQVEEPPVDKDVVDPPVEFEVEDPPVEKEAEQPQPVQQQQPDEQSSRLHRELEAEANTFERPTYTVDTVHTEPTTIHLKVLRPNETETASALNFNDMTVLEDTDAGNLEEEDQVEPPIDEQADDASYVDPDEEEEKKGEEDDEILSKKSKKGDGKRKRNIKAISKKNV